MSSGEQPTPSPSDALRFILIRYDTDAGMAQGVWEVVKQIQAHLSWLQHVNQARERDAAKVLPNQPVGRPTTSRGVKCNE
jgi:hypothetical protein